MEIYNEISLIWHDGIWYSYSILICMELIAITHTNNELDLKIATTVVGSTFVLPRRTNWIFRVSIENKRRRKHRESCEIWFSNWYCVLSKQIYKINFFPFLELNKPCFLCWFCFFLCTWIEHMSNTFDLINDDNASERARKRERERENAIYFD